MLTPKEEALIDHSMLIIAGIIGGLPTSEEAKKELVKRLFLSLVDPNKE